MISFKYPMNYIILLTSLGLVLVSCPWIRLSAGDHWHFKLFCVRPTLKNILCLHTEHQGVHKHSFRNVRAFQESNWNLEMLVFKEREKPENPEKNLSDQSREPTTNSTYIWRRVRELNPGHIAGRASALTAPSLPPVDQGREEVGRVKGR